MLKFKHTRRIFISWLLLAVFMLPIMIKSFHVCQYETDIEWATSKANGHHVDKCFICQFAFSTFGAAATIAMAAVVSILLGTVVTACVQKAIRIAVVIISLRAPPCALLIG